MPGSRSSEAPEQGQTEPVEGLDIGPGIAVRAVQSGGAPCGAPEFWGISTGYIMLAELLSAPVGPEQEVPSGRVVDDGTFVNRLPHPPNPRQAPRIPSPARLDQGQLPQAQLHNVGR